MQLYTKIRWRATRKSNKQIVEAAANRKRNQKWLLEKLNTITWIPLLCVHVWVSFHFSRFAKHTHHLPYAEPIVFLLTSFQWARTLCVSLFTFSKCVLAQESYESRLKCFLFRLLLFTFGKIPYSVSPPLFLGDDVIFILSAASFSRVINGGWSVIPWFVDDNFFSVRKISFISFVLQISGAHTARSNQRKKYKHSS